jgi:hypothetical protein
MGQRIGTATHSVTKMSMSFLSTMENLNSKKQRGSQKPAIRTIASHNSNQPETRINATKESKTNAMEKISAMKSSFAPTISMMDIQMPNVDHPHNPKGVNAKTTHHNDWNINHDWNHQQDCSYQNNQDNQNNQQCSHCYLTCSQQEREENHQQQEASDDHSQHMTNHSESDDEIFALEEKCNVNNNDQNIITKQVYIPEIAIGVLADVVTN